MLGLFKNDPLFEIEGLDIKEQKLSRFAFCPGALVKPVVWFVLMFMLWNGSVKVADFSVFSPVHASSLVRQ